MRRLSEESAMVTPAVHGFDGAFHSIVVSEARTSPAAFSGTVPVRCFGGDGHGVQSTTKAKPFCAWPRPVGVRRRRAR